MEGERRWEILYSFAAARCVHMLRECPVMITPHRPVGMFSSTRYSTRRPAVLHVERRMEAYLSLPTQPMKRVEDGGRIYYGKTEVSIHVRFFFSSAEGMKVCEDREMGNGGGRT